MIGYSPIVYKSNLYVSGFALILFVVSGFYPLLGIFLFLTILTTFSFSKNFLLLSFIWIVLFQNGFIAYASYFITDSFQFKLLHGISFLVIALYVLLFLISKPVLDRQEKFIFNYVLSLLVLSSIFFLIGFVKFGLLSSSVYLRLFTTPILILLAGIFLSRGGNQTIFNISFKVFFLLVLSGTILQYFFPSVFTLIANDVSYYKLKINPSIENSNDVVNYLNANTYLNLPWDFKAMRAVGFMKSFISGSYFLVISSILLFWYSSKLKIILVFVIVAVSLASKGALLTVFFFLMWYFLKRKLKFTTSLVLGMHIIFIIILIWAGLQVKNEHVIGFVSGSKYLSGIGNGLGFSGNLSTFQPEILDPVDISKINYLDRFKDGSESVYGVLFSSMGIFSLIYLFGLYKIVKLIFNRFINSKYYYISFLAVIVSLQGIFQEEVFSQYVLGLVFLFAGFKFNNIKDGNDYSTYSS